MRNVLIHGYEIVDHEVVWATIHEDVPAVVAAIRAVLADHEATEPHPGQG